MACTQIILKFQYTCYCSPQDAPLYWIPGTWWELKVQERHLSSHVRTGWAEQQFPEEFSTVFGSTIYYSHILWQHKKRDRPQLPVLSMPIQLSGELLEQFKALFPVLPAHRTPCAGHSILRKQSGWAKACSWTTWNKQFKNSFRTSSSKLICISLPRHTSLRETFMCVSLTL